MSSIRNEALVAAVRARLLQDSRISGLCLDACSCDGYVCLAGCVDTEEQRQLAVEIVTGMIGVRNVRDQIRVMCPEKTASR